MFNFQGPLQSPPLSGDLFNISHFFFLVKYFCKSFFVFFKVFSVFRLVIYLLKENIPVKDIINDSVANFNSLFEIEKKPIFLKEGGFGYKLIEYDNNIIYNENILNINSKILDKRQKLKNIECRDFILLYDNKDIMFNFERRQKLCYNFCYIY